jgi:DNA-binding NtrC family response regulator
MNAGRSQSILVLEDDVMCRVITRNILRRAGFDVICARDFYEAIEVVEASVKIDIAVVDMLMPPGTPHGLAFAQIARRRRPELRILFMSAAIDPTGIALYEQDAAFLCKPFAPATLLDAVTRMAA